MRLSGFEYKVGEYSVATSAHRTVVANRSTSMQTTIANYMLPAMQVVCHLIVSQNPGTNITTSTPVGIEPPQQLQNCPECECGATTLAPENSTLPEGYVAYHDLGFAYKVYDEVVTWIAARKRCIEEGAQLARIDSYKKIAYLESQKKSNGWAHVGIVRMYDDAKAWIAVSTGLPIESEPPCGGGCSLSNSGACLEISFSEMKLNQYGCTSNANFVCELPILEKHNVSAN